MRGRGRTQKKQRTGYGREPLSAVASLNHLLALLTGCTDERLATFTVEGLCRMYDVEEKLVEYQLTIERQNRARAMVQ
jgi:hypothetical protein